MAGLLLVGILLILAWSPASALGASCTTTFTDATNDHMWFTAGNWSGGVVPSSTSDACVPASKSVQLIGSTTVHSVTVSAGGSVALDACSTNVLTASSGFTNAGTVTFNALDARACGGQSALVLGSAATLTNSGTINFVCNSNGNCRVQGNVVNTGTVALQRETSNAGAASLVGPGTFDNQGAVTIAEGSALNVARGGSTPDTALTFFNDGGGSIAGSGTLSVGSGNVYQQGAGTTIGTNQVRVIQSTVNYTGAGASSVAVQGATSLSGDIASGQSLALPSCANAVVSATGSFTNSGTITMDNGFFCGGSYTDHTVLALPPGQVLTNSGTIVLTTTDQLGRGVDEIQAPVINTGLLDVQDNAVITATGTGLDNRGTVNVAAGWSLTLPQAGAAITNEAALDIAAGGSVSSTSDFTQTGGTSSLAAGATLSAPHVRIQAGKLGGTGTVSGDLLNDGEIAPGDAGPGTLSVTGAFTQSAAGTLDARVTASGHDLLSVSGAATLDGTLAVSTTGITPTLGQSFQVVKDSSQSGSFPTVTGIASGPYKVVYDSTDVALVVTTASQLPTLSVNDVSVDRPAAGDVTATFTVTLSAPAPGGASVHYQTVDGSARAPGDYASTSGTLHFAANSETSKTVAVTVHPTLAPDADKTFQLRLTAPSGANIAGGPGTATLRNTRIALSSITPAVGGQGADVTATLTGAGFTGSPAVKLTRPGQADITATGVVVSNDARTMTATFLLTGALGPWNVEASLPDRGGAVGTLPGGFAIAAATPPRVESILVGPPVIRGGFPWTGGVAYTNTGNVDAQNALIQVTGFQSGADVQVLSGDASVAQEDTGASHSVVLSIPRIPANSSGTILIRFVPAGQGHSVYHLQAATLMSAAPREALGPPDDPSAKVTGELTAHTATSAQGVLHISGKAGSGDVKFNFFVTHGPVPSGGPPAPSVKKTVAPGGATTYTYRAAIPSTASGPPPAGAANRRGPVARPASDTEDFYNLVANLPSNPGILQLWQVYWGLRSTGVKAQIAQEEKAISDCLLQKGLISQASHDDQILKADGSVPLGLIGTASTVLPGLASVPAKELALLSAVVESSWGQRLYGGTFGGPGDLALDHFGNDFTFMSPADRRARVLELCPPSTPPPATAPPAPSAPSALEIRTAGDPNDKFGPQGFGAGHFVLPSAALPYGIQFQNVPSASAPAAEVKVSDQLDPSKVDLSSLSLGAVYFGDHVVSPPPHVQSWSTDVDLRPAQNLIVHITVGLNRSTGLLSWDMQSIDPATGQPSTDPLTGFLPPDAHAPAGEGGVTFTVSPRSTLATGAQITNRATIVFDRNGPINTPTWQNTIDTSSPASRVVSVKASRSHCGDLRAAWSGSDTGAGVDYFDIFVSDNSGAEQLWRFHTRQFAASYHGRPGHLYRFRSVATDGVGHVQAAAGATKRAAVPRCPVLRRLRISPRSFPAAPRGASATSAAKKGQKPSMGTLVSYLLNRRGSVRFTVSRARNGRLEPRRGKTRCVSQTKRNHQARKCKLTATLRGAFVRKGMAGPNRFRFTGRLAGTRLKPGAYVLTATPITRSFVGRSLSITFIIRSR